MPRLLLALAFAVAVTAVACTGGDESTSDSTEGPAETPPSGFVSYSSPSRGYSIFIPSDWLPLPDETVEFEGESYSSDVFEGTPENGFITNLSVTSFQFDERTPEQIYETEVARSKEAYSDLVVEDIVIGGRPARLLHFTTGALTGDYLWDQSQVLLLIDTRLWQLSLSTALGLRNKHLPAFETMWQSFAPVAEP